MTEGTGEAEDTGEAAARVFRDERAAVLATLIRHVGDFQLAEEAMADAFEAALATWPRDGVPRNPAGWITVVARRRAIDRLRRERAVTDRAGGWPSSSGSTRRATRWPLWRAR
jgi:RNA polymerase sigma-70 factor (ECF subfamily)